MDTQSIRSAILSAPEKTQDIEIPDWLKGALEAGTELMFRDIPSTELALLQKQAEKDPTQTDVHATAAMIVRSLANKATGELIFQQADRDAIAAMGATKLASLGSQMGEFFGFVQKPVEAAKKN